MRSARRNIVGCCVLFTRASVGRKWGHDRRASSHLHARSVGFYYPLRSLAIGPAASVGALLWNVAPALPFYVAALVGLAGTAVVMLTVDERHAG